MLSPRLLVTPLLRLLRPGECATRLAALVGEPLDRRFGWDRLPLRLGVVTLLGIRDRLRRRNLYGAGGAPAPGPGTPTAGRSVDGTGNDPHDPTMGAVGAPFGRNAPPVPEAADAWPDPWDVSDRLLKRERFLPAETLNLLAAAWVQFEVHDWFVHQLDRGTPPAGKPGDARLRPPPFRTQQTVERSYPAFVSDQTHWWDASQLYGATEAFATAMRTDGGKLHDERLLEEMEPFTRAGASPSAPVPNLWLGGALFHILFAKEHNAICDLLQAEYPRWGPDRVYETARLINAAVMAKIHTVEWTPAIVAHPTTAHGARAIWSGVLGRLKRYGVADEVLTGIPGSKRSHDGARYALTEEFVAVYRLHPLIPDEVTFHRVSDHAEIERVDFEQLAVGPNDPARPRRRLQEIGIANALYSLGIACPGDITLHNYPRFLREFRPLEDAGPLDIGAIDILRTREVGVPRYNNFRRLFRLRPAESFLELAGGNPQWAEEIRDVYRDRLEEVDLLIGMFGERKPRGFAFSDTAFRVFLLMAARRLRSDRLFTTDFTPEVYTWVGMKWIEEARLADMLRRHVPELSDALAGVTDVFAPWNR